MIELENAQVTSRITICNYERYQSCRNDCETQAERKWNDSGTTRRTDNNVKNVNNEKKDKCPSAFSSAKSFCQADVDAAQQGLERSIVSGEV